MANNKSYNPHALIIPYPLQGHVIPAVHLAIKLASKGFTITFVNTQFIHHQISKSQPDTTEDYDIFSVARKSGLDIHYHTVSDGMPLAFDRSLNHDEFMASLLHVFWAHVDDLVQNIIAAESTPPLRCLIADTFFVWPSSIAKKFNLVNVSFWTEPALVFTLYYHMNLLRKNGHFGFHDNREDTIDYIPGVAGIEPKDLMSYLQATDTSTIVHKIIFKAFEDVKKADYVIGNTIEELEQDIISALQVEKPFYSIGPIFPSGFTKSSVATSLWPESDCTNWLDTKPHGSVLYVSFGSYAHVSKNDLTEIAHGILLSNVNFVWVLRPDIVSSDDAHPLPAGFTKECEGRGMVLPWCTQIEVLSHPAVGGFLTHCGWNSILESVWCGIPMLCFPLLTDQFTNRKLVTDDWNIGIGISDGKSIGRNKVSELISLVMNGKLGDEFRSRMKQVKKRLKDAMQEDGSSEKNLNKFINEISKTCA
ncbi:7-deoxyloganetin glucosyltransferase [Ranunculus cassubicifolius]